VQNKVDPNKNVLKGGVDFLTRVHELDYVTCRRRDSLKDEEDNIEYWLSRRDKDKNGQANPVNSPQKDK